MDELQECVSGSDTPEEWYNAKEVAEFIDAFLAGLGRTNRLLFVRRYWYQDSFAELSRMTGLRQGAIRTRLFRLREQLQSFLLGQGVNV